MTQTVHSYPGVDSVTIFTPCAAELLHPDLPLLRYAARASGVSLYACKESIPSNVIRLKTLLSIAQEDGSVTGPGHHSSNHHLIKALPQSSFCISPQPTTLTVRLRQNPLHTWSRWRSSPSCPYLSPRSKIGERCSASHAHL